MSKVERADRVSIFWKFRGLILKTVAVVKVLKTKNI